MRKADADFVEACVPLVVHAANHVDLGTVVPPSTWECPLCGMDNSVKVAACTACDEEKEGGVVNIEDAHFADNGRHEKVKFILRRHAGQESTIWLEFLYGALLSSKCLDDLTALNPHVRRSERHYNYNYNYSVCGAKYLH